MTNRSRAFQRTTDKLRTLTLSPQRVAQKNSFCFFNKIKFQSNKVCYKVSLCENFHQRRSCSIPIPPSNGPYTYWRETLPFNLTFSLKVIYPLKIAKLARSVCHSWATCLTHCHISKIRKTLLQCTTRSNDTKAMIQKNTDNVPWLAITVPTFGCAYPKPSSCFSMAEHCARYCDRIVILFGLTRQLTSSRNIRTWTPDNLNARRSS